MAKMQAATQPFETMLYPGKTHSISGVSAHVYLTIINFLNRHVGLPPVDPDGAGPDDLSLIHLLGCRTCPLPHPATQPPSPMGCRVHSEERPVGKQSGTP